MTNEPRANALSVLYSSRSIGKDLGSLYGSFEFENKKRETESINAPKKKNASKPIFSRYTMSSLPLPVRYKIL